MTADFVLRPFEWSDVPAITAIYRHYVETSPCTFDTTAPGERAMADKFGAMVELGHPVLVAEWQGKFAAYAYASVYRPRPAYRYTCEDSIYIDPKAAGQGLGSHMLERLVADARAFGFKQMIAVITASGESSIALHTKFGFRHIGRYEKLGYKFDAWHDIVHMQLAL
ncbi:GNAT family N-acetyltransferase [Devosia nitrariae]|uniref:N-acetyltransferase n=1 Tax=Devosia nitrariae TaxID=2071872 RepID=A0ABQ5W482_9HYPH|nr:GNAT family N-acetyltransferase [Devosia nitrariae]GLQ54460.1 N-acetyltransferase [Devosia nitrariae]